MALDTPFAALHQAPHAPLFLPNAWDHASAYALAARGFRAIGTTSLGVAAGLGVADGAGETREATLRLARMLRNGPFLLSVDAEGGFSDDPALVASLARELAAAGVAGINLEDGRADGTLTPPDLHAEKIAAVKAVAPDLFVNARTDTHWHRVDQHTTETRLRAYERAGADGAFVPGLTDRTAIAALAAALTVPLNVLHSPEGPAFAELPALGVRRLSLGSLLYRRALTAALTEATTLRTPGTPPTPLLPYSAFAPPE